MKSIGAFEAKTHLSALLERVARGEEITITKHGHPVARLVPMEHHGRRDPKQVAEAIRAIRKGIKLEGATIRQPIGRARGLADARRRIFLVV